MAVGLAAGALTYFVADRRIERRGAGGGLPLALGALLDGVPEQAVLGIGLAGGAGRERRAARRDLRVEPAGGDRLGGDMLAAGWTRGRVVALWSGVAVDLRRRDGRRATRSTDVGGRHVRPARSTASPRARCS